MLVTVPGKNTKIVLTEIGGIDDDRHSTPARMRSKLTNWPLLQQSPQNVGWSSQVLVKIEKI